MKVIVFCCIFVCLISASLSFILNGPSNHAESDENDNEVADKVPRVRSPRLYERRRLSLDSSLFDGRFDDPFFRPFAEATGPITTTTAGTTLPPPTTIRTTTPATTPSTPTNCNLAKLVVHHFPGPCQAEITCVNGNSFTVNGCINTLTFISQITPGGKTNL